jgi:ADP-heptose:LPS heptosyltransferase
VSPHVEGPRETSAVLLAPDSDYGPSHEWSAECWCEVAREARALSGRRITVAGLARCRRLAKTVADALGNDAAFIELDPLGGALNLLGAHGMCISANNSLVHLAAHTGTLCVTLFGPDDPARNRPLGRQHVVVCKHVECAPCLLARCPLDMRCQRELETSTVIAAMREQWTEVQAAASP